MTFTSASEPLGFKLYYRRLGEFMANTCGEPVGEHIRPESKVVGPRDGCPRTLELVSEPWYAIAATSRSGPTTVGALGLPELDTTSPSTGGSPDTHPDQSSNVDEQANNSSSMSIVDSRPITSKVVDQHLTPLTQTMPHEIQQSPGQYPSALWGTLAGPAATYDASVAEVDGSMKLTLPGYSNLSDKLGESTLCRSTTSGTDCIPISTGPQPWFVEEPSHVVNNDAVPDSRVIMFV
ncbi:hypothetical protein MRS44_018251 [Fusarium solani]|uniref:uncharacterized protein n=1 Tax=Fusarium solani TaxID=169388 RepID=UPI0032C43BAB|nr:hypothetical protein MRS44_018251 [Fusarium solani]